MVFFQMMLIHIDTVNAADSSSFEMVGQGDFAIAYVDESFSTGDYFTDTIEIGGAVVTNLTMGLGRNTTIEYGLVGVGYTSNVASVQTTNTIYPNLPVTMKNDGLINTVAYSLWLNDLGKLPAFASHGRAKQEC
jgi:elongation factor G